MASRATQLIKEIDRDLINLRKEYAQFLGGVTMVEPIESRGRLEDKVRELRNLTKMKTEDMFRADNLIARVMSQISLWERQLQKKMGHVRKRKKTQETEAESDVPAAVQSKREQRRVKISDVKSQRDQIVALYDDYTRTNLSLGVKSQVSFSKFQSFIEKQTDSVKSRKGKRNVLYQIVVKDNKAAIKSKASDD